METIILQELCKMMGISYKNEGPFHTMVEQIKQSFERNSVMPKGARYGPSADENIAGKLRGNTLRAYVALLGSDNGVMGVRELQRKLGFSSPALAAYHLRKLEDLGLVAEESGNYRVLKEVKVGVLEQFIRLGTFMLPRYVFYATLFSTLLLYFVSQLKELQFYSIFGLIFGVIGTLVFWFETLRVWRQKP